jgi:hypothetical protein
MSEQLKKWFLAGLASIVLVLFSGVWLWIGFKILFFDGSAATPTLSFTDAQVSVAGFLASAVGAGTASVLGIEIQKITQASGEAPPTLAAQVGQAAASSWLLVVGIALYALVGCFVLIAWFFNSEIAPEMVSAFSLGVLGWLAGAFAAVFRVGAG